MRTRRESIGQRIGQALKGARYLTSISALAALALVSACSGIEYEETGRVLSKEDKARKEAGSVFGTEGLTLFGGKGDGDNSPSGIGVNSFLWRASLDTISFMPLSSADPFGGVIITDWYTPPGSPLERFKMTVYILDRKLRADALKVSVFRQARVAPNAGWNDAAVASTTPTELEDAILTRARQLHVATIGQP